jgi:murein DD-endopeptidase MepM/ murein hydrolase activator NlpD
MAAAGSLVVLSPGLLAAAAFDDLPGPPTPPALVPPPCPGHDASDLLCQLGPVLGTIPLVPSLEGLAPTRRGENPGPSAPSPAPAPAPVTLSAPATASDPLATDAVADFANEPFLQSLVEILSHRWYDGGADLQHFGGAGSADRPGSPVRDGGHTVAPWAPPGGGGQPAPAGDPFPWQVLAPAVMIAATAVGARLLGRGSADTRTSSPRSGRASRYCTIGAAAASVALASAGTAFATRTAPPPGPHDTMGPRTASAPAPVTWREHIDSQPESAPLWDQLVTLERRLLEEASRLAVVESEIRRILGAAVEPSGADGAMFRASRVARLVAEHEATAAAYRDCLEIEYGLYRGAAEDPRQRLQLLRGAAATPGSAATDAVTYSLLVAETEAKQERVIARAEQMLTRYGSATKAQLRALAQQQSFIPPELAPITQVFGPTDFSLEPALRYHGAFYPHFHTGIDLGGPLDTPVQATADGVVLVATASVDGRGHYVGYGNYVLVAHPDGFASLYGHLDGIVVQPGATVHQGQIIGLEGSTGWSTGPHVHFEIRHDQEFVDPLPLVSR